MNEIEKMARALESAGQASAEYFRSEVKKALARGEKHLNRCSGKLRSIYEFEAEALINAGYGDVKQAVNEFAEKVFNCLEGYNLSYFDGEYVRPFDEYKIARIIYGIKKEICGE